MRLEDPSAVVTGAASGIGKSTVVYMTHQIAGDYAAGAGCRVDRTGARFS